MVAEHIVELQSGTVRGKIEQHYEGFEYYSFKGIPYAEPPVGELRFKDPIPKKKWTGTIDCFKDGPKCLQYDFLFESASYEEDCLHLNVFTRSINKAKKNSPVIMIVHAGAFFIGSNESLMYGPGYFIRKDVVLVVPNYRLGVLGFLDLEDEIAPGNQGFKDLVLALKWIQENIKKFGGNPDNVTVFGAVSGGAAAHFLALSPLTKGLMHKVISGGAVAYNPFLTVCNRRSSAIKLCSLLGKNLTDTKEIFNFLKSVDVKSLQEAQERLRVVCFEFPFGPVIDSKSTNPFMPSRRYLDQCVHLPYLVGCNAMEGSILITDIPKEELFKMCNQDFGKCITYNGRELLNRYNLNETQVRRLYYKSETMSKKNQKNFMMLGHDIYFLDGIHRFAKLQAEQSTASTYLYRFDYVSPYSVIACVISDLTEVEPMCGHFDEMPFLFKMHAFETNLGLPQLKTGTRHYKMMEQMVEMWTNFARYGKPTVDISELIPVHWKPIANGTNLRYLNISEDITMQITVNVEQKFLSAKNIRT